MRGILRGLNPSGLDIPVRNEEVLQVVQAAHEASGSEEVDRSKIEPRKQARFSLCTGDLRKAVRQTVFNRSPVQRAKLVPTSPRPPLAAGDHASSLVRNWVE